MLTNKLVAWYCSVCCKKVHNSGIYLPKSDEEMPEFESCLRASGLSDSAIDQLRRKRKNLAKVRVCTWHTPNYSKLKTYGVVPEYLGLNGNPNSPTQIVETINALTRQLQSQRGVLLGKDEKIRRGQILDMSLPKDEDSQEGLGNENRSFLEDIKPAEIINIQFGQGRKRQFDEDELQIEDVIESTDEPTTSQFNHKRSRMNEDQTGQSNGNHSSNMNSPRIVQIDSQESTCSMGLSIPNGRVLQQTETMALLKGSYFLIPGDTLLDFLRNCSCEENLCDRLISISKDRFPFVHTQCPCGGMQVFRGLPKTNSL